MCIIEPMDLRGIDLNLLVSLQVLLTQRHVTRSAEKLDLTQPAMSASLARSRTLFRDKLLVRGPEGLVLTPRGEQILEQLNKIMEVTERLIAVPGEFTPETCSTVGTQFHIFLCCWIANLAYFESRGLQHERLKFEDQKLVEKDLDLKERNRLIGPLGGY